MPAKVVTYNSQNYACLHIRLRPTKGSATKQITYKNYKSQDLIAILKNLKEF